MEALKRIYEGNKSEIVAICYFVFVSLAQWIELYFLSGSFHLEREHLFLILTLSLVSAIVAKKITDCYITDVTSRRFI